MSAKIDFDSALPLGEFQYTPVGWDLCPGFSFARASWRFELKDAAIAATYRNHEEGRDYTLGSVPAHTAVESVINWVAQKHESLTLGDIILVGGQVFFVAQERGEA